MKPNGKRFNLRLKPCATTPTPPAIKEGKYVRHLSLSHEKESKKSIQQKKKIIDEAVAYCREHQCKGYKAITDLGLDLEGPLRECLEWAIFSPGWPLKGG